MIIIIKIYKGASRPNFFKEFEILKYHVCIVKWLTCLNQYEYLYRCLRCNDLFLQENFYEAGYSLTV